MKFSESFLQKLEQFEKLVLEWNKIHNLISRPSEADIRKRHTLDSVEILQYLPQGIEGEQYFTICDFGSGAGFPAVTTALYFKYDKPLPSVKIYAYESTGKKCAFLKICKDELGLDNFEVKNIRIEAEENVKADIITARAFAELGDIFKAAKKFLKPGTKFILHKGVKAEEEIKKARTQFYFEYELKKNSTSEGSILLAEKVKSK